MGGETAIMKWKLRIAWKRRWKDTTGDKKIGDIKDRIGDKKIENKKEGIRNKKEGTGNKIEGIRDKKKK